VDIIFRTTRLQKACTSDKVMQKRWGAERARRIRQRLGELRAADTLAILGQTGIGRCHELSGNHQGRLSVDLDGPYRLLFEPANEPVPLREDGGLDWTSVTAVLIVGVEDTHG
jgi:proteic killer suppression protein